MEYDLKIALSKRRYAYTRALDDELIEMFADRVYDEHLIAGLENYLNVTPKPHFEAVKYDPIEKQLPKVVSIQRDNNAAISEIKRNEQDLCLINRIKAI